MDTRARIGRALFVPLFLVVLYLPLSLDPVQHRLLAILAAVVCLWTTEALPVPVTALMIAPALVVFGITDPKSAFTPYADPLLFLFYGSFFIAAAMQRHGLDRRIARAVVSAPWVAGSPSRARIAMMSAGLLLSMWISNTAASAILVPILMGMLGSHALNDDSPESPGHAGGLLSIAYACSVGGMGTLVGTPPNLIAVRLLKEVNVSLSFIDFSIVGVPTALVLAGIVYLTLARRFPPTSLQVEVYNGPGEPFSRGEALTALSLGVAILGFIIPPAAKAAGLSFGPALDAMFPASTVAMIAAGLLFLLHDEDGKAVLPWPQAMQVDWGLIMLFGGGITLGTQMFRTGLAETLGRGVIAMTGVSDLWTLTAIAIMFTIYFTEVCSNTATANMVIPLILGVTTELNLPPVAPVLGVALGASCAFMMPIGTGPNAVAFGTGHLRLGTMVRAGFVLNLLCGVALFALLRLLCPLMGWS